MDVIDYLVVGSGASGSMAAQTLVEAGKNVTMLDVGAWNESYDKLVKAADFVTMRTTDQEQHRYFIGDAAEGVVWGDVGKGAQITPPRQHLTQYVNEYMPIRSNTFSPIESLGYGGLGIGWGLQCWEFSEEDLVTAGMDSKRMIEAYEKVSERIGVSATKDEASDYIMGKLKTFQKSPDMDRNHKRVYGRYLKHQKRLNKRGFYLGRTPLAIITKDKDGRKAYKYRDMDYYSDKDQSGWRPWMTVNALKKHKNFTYIGGHLVTKFVEKRDYTEVECLTVPGNKKVAFRCKTLVLAANPLSSGRIVLRSLGNAKTRLPLLCNPYTYIPCLQPAMMGKKVETHKLGFAQLTMFQNRHNDMFSDSIASLYSYQSLMLFRIIKQLPLNFADSKTIMRYLMSGVVIMGVHHPDSVSKDKFLQLVPDKKTPTGDILKVQYALSAEDRAEMDKREKQFIRTGRDLGLFALARLNPGYGASVHYAGTLPFSDEDKPFTLSKAGRLHGTKNVYVADSAGFNYLPAKGLTFTLLANAHITAENILNGKK